MKHKSFIGLIFVITLLTACNLATFPSDNRSDTNQPVPSLTIPPPIQEASGSPANDACSGVLTSPNQEGPYYKEGSPQRSSLIEDGMPGTPIRLIGIVFDQTCNPIPGARVDFWQADASGVYDNQGYNLRGHVLSDENGAYAIETIVPGVYPGRPPHIHVKVFAPDGRELLTTQLYFPGSEGSADVSASPDLLVTYLEVDDSSFLPVALNFVVQY